MFVWDGGATYLYLYLPAASVFAKYEKNGTLARLGLLAQSAFVTFACRRLPWRRVLPGLVRGARGTSAADGI